VNVRQLCDHAEAALLARMEAAEQFQLLRVIAQGSGAKGLDNYETPADKLAGVLTDLAADEDDAAAARRAAVMAAVQAGAGEVA
jgi:hypothetical protein